MVSRDAMRKLRVAATLNDRSVSAELHLAIMAHVGEAEDVAA